MGTLKYPLLDKVAVNVLQMAGDMCEYDNTHYTFFRIEFKKVSF